jgi:hypothetical protein
MTKGSVSVKNSAWRFGAAPFTGDIFYFRRLETGEERELMHNSDVRDAFSCGKCGATLLFDGRKMPPHNLIGGTS